jgi:hypothetical protein
MSFVVETKKDFDRLVDQYPGRILFCDRTRIQDTLQGKCIDQTSHLHEVRSYEKVIPEEYMGVLEPAIKEDKKKNRQAKSEVNGSIRNWQVVISTSHAIVSTVLVCLLLMQKLMIGSLK